MQADYTQNEQQVEFESIRILFKNAQKSFVGAVFVAITLIILTRNSVSIYAAFSWLSILLLTYVARTRVVQLFFRDTNKQANAKIWLNRFRLASACCGIAWGLAAYFTFLPNNPQFQFFLVMALAGVCAGSLINLSIDNTSAALFTILLWLTASPKFLSHENNATALVFVLLAAFIVFVGIASKQLAKGLMQSIQSRLIAESKEKEISKLTQRQSLHLEHTPMGVIEWDEHLQVMAWNKACVDIFGYTSLEAVGKHISFFMSDLINMQTPHIIDRLEQENNDLKQLFSKSNEVVYCEFSNTVLKNEQGELVGMASMVQDKTAFIASQEKIYQLAYFDTLTGLPNRGLLLDRIKQALISSKRSKSFGMLAFIDLDHFKAINDVQGHNAGDHLLQVVASRLQKNIRAADTAARLGGDEFVLVLSDIGKTKKEAEAFSKQIIEKIAAAINSPVEFEDFQHQCSASIGICLFNNDSLDSKELLRRADVSMYLSKKQGRNAYQFYDAAQQPEYEYQLKLKHDLNHVLEAQQLELHLQGQYDRNSNIKGAEVLLRWNHPEFGTVMPNDFIPLAEETGAIIPIGAWVLNQTCALLKKWHADDFSSNLMISVNVSAIQFNHPDFVQQVQKAIKDSGCDAAKLCIELTESSIITHLDESIKKMHKIKAMGVSLAIDDFGTGYSSLSALKNLPLNELKIDKSFVKDFTKNPVDLTIVQTILQMGKNLNLRIVAEGVETENQMAYLSNYGCSMFQGYLFAKPCSIIDFERTIDKQVITVTQAIHASTITRSKKTKQLLKTDIDREKKLQQGSQLTLSSTKTLIIQH